MRGEQGVSADGAQSVRFGEVAELFPVGCREGLCQQVNVIQPDEPVGIDDGFAGDLVMGGEVGRAVYAGM